MAYPHKSAARMAVFLVAAVLAAIAALAILAGPASAQSNTPDDEFCLSCHREAGQVMELPSGEQLYISIDPDDYAASVHADVNLSCNACHPGITEYPHPERSLSDRRDYTLTYKNTCASCHDDKVFPDGMHQQLLENGNKNAPVCADCHNPHTQPKLTDANGELTGINKAKIAQTCARCHSAIYDEYASSVHGAAAIGENNPDVPVCIDCHGVHEISDPRTNEFRLASPRMCGDCHTDETMMSKYGLSTQVYDTYVADFHGTTWVLFEKETPDGETNKAVCYDCHGVHAIASTSDPQKSLAVKQNMLKACQKCHPDASDNFPDSWLSHYIPTPERTPLVYYVNLFYKILIPGVIIPMGLFVLTDAFRRIFRRKQRGVVETSSKVEEKKEQ